MWGVGGNFVLTTPKPPVARVGHELTRHPLCKGGAVPWEEHGQDRNGLRCIRRGRGQTSARRQLWSMPTAITRLIMSYLWGDGVEDRCP